MAVLRRKISRLRQVVQGQVHNRLDFVAYDDARTDFTCRSQEAYFNCGYERGHFAGIAESSTATGTHDPAVRAFQGQLCSAVAEARLPKAKVAAALMDVARASRCHSAAQPGRRGKPVTTGFERSGKAEKS